MLVLLNLDFTLKNTVFIGNVMLEDTFERHILDQKFADERLGLYVIRGENLVLLGELDLDKELNNTAMTEVPLEELLREKEARRKERVSVSTP